MGQRAAYSIGSRAETLSVLPALRRDGFARIYIMINYNTDWDDIARDDVKTITASGKRRMYTWFLSPTSHIYYNIMCIL